MNSVYDTSMLQNAIKNDPNFRSYSAFGKKVVSSMNERYGKAITLASVMSHISGYWRPSDDECRVYTSLLGIPTGKIMKMYRFRVDVSDQKEKVSTSTEEIKEETKSKKNQKVSRKFDFTALDKILAEKKVSEKKLVHDLKVNTKNFKEGAVRGPMNKTLIRVADYLAVPTSRFFIEDVTEDVVDTSSTDTISIEIKNVKEEEKQNIDLSGFKIIGEELNVQKIFNILNDNTILAGSHSIKNQKYLESILSKLDTICSAISSIEERLEKLEKSPATDIEVSSDENDKNLKKENTKKGNIIKSKPVAISPMNEEEFKALIKGYDPNDDLKGYSSKIYSMINVLSVKNKSTQKQELHKYYRSMVSTYACPFDELEKQYFADHGHKAKGSTVLIYSNELYRRIFYNMIATDFSRIK